MTPAGPLVFSRAAIREVDRLAAAEFAMPTIVLMENAAAGAAAIAAQMLPAPAPVLIVCGGGNNGGDGLAIARHLSNAGFDDLVIALLEEPPAPGDAATNLAICRRMNLRIVPSVPHALAALPGSPALVIDAIFGTGLSRPVAGPAADAIAAINHARAATGQVLAVDIPSGLDCDSGLPLGAAVRADVTATFVGWKQGFLTPSSREYTGRIEVVPIGAPAALAHRLARPFPRSN